MLQGWGFLCSIGSSLNSSTLSSVLLYYAANQYNRDKPEKYAPLKPSCTKTELHPIWNSKDWLPMSMPSTLRRWKRLLLGELTLLLEASRAPACITQTHTLLILPKLLKPILFVLWILFSFGPFFAFKECSSLSKIHLALLAWMIDQLNDWIWKNCRHCDGGSARSGAMHLDWFRDIYARYFDPTCGAYFCNQTEADIFRYQV